MLQFLDVFFTVVHLAIVLFNLFGWIPRATRKAHFISLLLTAVAWFILGIWFGIGYCPVTDWQWKIKSSLGEQNIPANFIEYIAEKLTGHDFDSSFVSTVIAVCFVLAVGLSIYVNFWLPVRKKNSSMQA